MHTIIAIKELGIFNFYVAGRRTAVARHNMILGGINRNTINPGVKRTIAAKIG